MLVFRVCGMRLKLCVFSLYCNPDLDDLIFECLLTSIAVRQAEDVRASFVFVGDLMAFIRSGRILRPRTIVVLQPLTQQLCLVSINWLSAQTMHVVEHLTC